MTPTTLSLITPAMTTSTPATLPLVTPATPVSIPTSFAFTSAFAFAFASIFASAPVPIVMTTPPSGFSIFSALRLAPGPGWTKIERIETKEGVLGGLRWLGFVAHQSVMNRGKTATIERARSKNNGCCLKLNPSDIESQHLLRRSAPEQRTQAQVQRHRKSHPVDLHGWLLRWWKQQNRAACSRR